MISKLSQRLFSMAMITAAVYAVTTAAVRLAALLLDFDAAAGFFSPDSLLYDVLIFLLLSCAVIFAVFAIATRGSFAQQQGEVQGGILLRFAATCAVIAAAVFFVLTFSSESEALSGLPLFCRRMVQISLVPTAGYFLLAAYGGERHPNLRAVASLCTVAFCLFYALYLYFETDMPMNAPNKLFDQITLILLALFFLYEGTMQARLGAGTPYIAAAFIACIFSFVVSVPNLLYTLLRSELLMQNTAHDFLMLAFSVYIVARLRPLAAAARAAADEVEPVYELLGAEDGVPPEETAREELPADDAAPPEQVPSPAPLPFTVETVSDDAPGDGQAPDTAETSDSEDKA